MREGSTNQFAAPQLRQGENLGYRDTLGLLRRRPTTDTLLATFAVPMGPLLVKEPLQLLGSGDANLLE